MANDVFAISKNSTKRLIGGFILVLFGISIALVLRVSIAADLKPTPAVRMEQKTP